MKTTEYNKLIESLEWKIDQNQKSHYALKNYDS